jgi:hypothetical protein
VPGLSAPWRVTGLFGSGVGAHKPFDLFYDRVEAFG